MKKVLFTLILLSLLGIPACTIIDNDNSIDNISGFAKSNLARETSPQVDTTQLDTLSKDNTAFALSFYHQIRQGDDNLVFSPISLSLALSMAMAGAEGSTETGMLDALQLTLPEGEIHPAFNALLLAIEHSQEELIEDIEGSKFQLNIANSIWGQAGFDFNEAFLDTLALNYGAGVYDVDYKQYPEEARKAINDWVAEETQDKIQDIIPPGVIDTLTRLVLANAIYFKGSWLYPFNASATHDALFTLLDDSQVTVEMMGLSGEHLSYTQGAGYQAVQLPYLSSDFTMTLLVPDAGVYAQFEDELNSQILASILSEMSSQPVDLEMPKFDFESDINANDPLIALGMSDAFNVSSANFSGITEAEELFITDVLHKATITVDEEGTEAAAATIVIIGMKSAPPEEAISLVVDRPFLFLIQHRPTGTILFMGRVMQP